MRVELRNQVVGEGRHTAGVAGQPGESRRQGQAVAGRHGLMLAKDKGTGK